MSIDLNASAFLRSLERRVNEMKRNARNEERILAEEAAEEMRRTVPYDTGELHDSIEVQAVSDGYIVKAGTDHVYPVEYGTLHSPPQPFFRPSLKRSARKWRARRKRI